MELEELKDWLAKAKLGDEEAFEKLFSAYKGVVYAMQQVYYIRIFDEDDWLQEGRLAMHDSIMNYQHGSHATFGLYFKRVLKNRIVCELRKQEAEKRRSNKNTISVEGEGVGYLAQRLVYNEQIEERMIVREILNNLTIEYSLLEARMLDAYINDSDIAMVAKELEIDLAKAESALGRAKRKLKKELYYQKDCL
ncbi:sigma-70 family RNA polymerase sigma factor [Enterococcus sp. AZ072]|uniref:sigma-70 family RNA polymerase sigma factor n=1 Tax=unclassified Enterococcus TaxID=2608891 RepID=UPI003D277FE9